MLQARNPQVNQRLSAIGLSAKDDSIFRGSEATTSKLEQIAGDARDYCEKEFKRELAEIDAARRAKLEAIRRKEAQRRAAAAAARARAAEAARLKARSAFDMLASY